jgi:hypothetical protein
MKGRLFILLLLMVLAEVVFGQRGAVPQQPARSPRAAAPIDLTGYWVAVVTEDWRWRMATPAKGDTIGIPYNPDGQKITQAWDWAKDTAAGNQCKAYGAGAIMRMPTRLHITWQDDNTMRIDADAGQQMKLLHFNATNPTTGTRTLQGYSAAEWVDVYRGRGAAPPAFGTGGMKVVTRNVSAGYLRKNGAPYSEQAVITEYFDRVPGPDGAEWLVVKTIVEDPLYLTEPFVTSSHFMHEADGAKWNPSPCQIGPPLQPPCQTEGGFVRFGCPP